MTTTTYPTLEQAVEAARQEREHWHCKHHSRRTYREDRHYIDSEITLHPTADGRVLRGTRAGWCYDAMTHCTDSHDPDPRATAFRAIAAAVVAVEELPDSETWKGALMEALADTYHMLKPGPTL